MKICNGMILGLLISFNCFGMEKEERKLENKPQQQSSSRADAFELQLCYNERDSIKESDLTPRTKMAAIIELDTTIKVLEMQDRMNANLNEVDLIDALKSKKDTLTQQRQNVLED